MNLPGNLGTLEWGDWILGLWSAVITGGSSAVLSATGLVVMDPNDFKMADHKVWTIAGGLFLWNGFLGMLAFLRQAPAPKRIIETTVQTFEQPSKPLATTVVTTTKETVTAPQEPPNGPQKKDTSI